ncbi:hypothetical protein SDC9_202203 [bioreactor metagenome]|uniref:Uncharacterized protein n=1 Tax=bioreactor metagenome TaxID=1076179 RepID=A0A645J4X8_9ZZZZ
MCLHAAGFKPAPMEKYQCSCMRYVVFFLEFLNVYLISIVCLKRYVADIQLIVYGIGKCEFAIECCLPCHDFCSARRLKVREKIGRKLHLIFQRSICKFIDRLELIHDILQIRLEYIKRFGMISVNDSTRIKLFYQTVSLKISL